MTAPRKRKAPEKKPVRRPSGLVVRSTLAAGHLVASRPSLFGGLLAFGVIFSFVAGNALWYQPRHPHPFLNTRDAFHSFQQNSEAATDPSDVTTYKIERQKPQDDVAQVIAASGPTAAGFPSETPGSETVLQIQQQLANLGFYDGPVDGQPGAKTATAIRFYQNKNGLEVNGQPSEDLLSALRVSNGQAAIVPADRPTEDVTTNSTAPDPVAAAIEAEAKPKPVVEAMIPPNPIPAKTTPAAKAVSVPAAKANTPKVAAPKPAPAKTVATKPATQKPVASTKPAAKPQAPVAKVVAKAPPGKASGMDIASIIDGDSKAAKATAKPAPEKAINTAVALPAKTAPAEIQPARVAAQPPKVAAGTAKGSATILKIQRALTKFAYANVPENGIAGPETKAAIRSFEKNYNLPVTGEPSDALLKKMKDVGVL